ncbi:biotin-dependent carboxyltransferase family protein [Sulfurovum sp.]|uniref:5-oxoprolinase subunit C family protein n=1 Tax=Sulfurovum sp. TaxID=1969726 RepID=UPI002867F8E1|nr:biotin-dependent carboxyltransferase family protein [Sulfurovum sp.]
MFKVLSGGMFSGIQDLGRQGYTHLGITPSGAMDEYAYRWSQKLLNEIDGNALEILLSGLKLLATAQTTIAVCGADLDFRINGITQPIWQTHHIQENDILSFEKKHSGMRAYLAVKGGFHVPKYQESYAATIKEHKGKKLEAGDTLPFTKSPNIWVKRVQEKYIPNYLDHLTLRIVLSYQHDYFTEGQKEKFFSTTYTLTPQIDRMGYKLQGEAMIPSKGGIISEGITFGAVQIPPDGQPIILLKERQTIGGYPKIGSVLPSDCFKLSQLPIGDKVMFEAISIGDAQEEMKVYNYFFNQQTLSKEYN